MRDNGFQNHMSGSAPRVHLKFGMLWLFGLFEIYGIVNRDVQPAIGLNYRIKTFENAFVDANVETRYWSIITDTVTARDEAGNEYRFRTININFLGSLGLKAGISISAIEISPQAGISYQYLQGILEDTTLRTRNTLGYFIGLEITIDGLSIGKLFVENPGVLFKYFDIYLDYRKYRLLSFENYYALIFDEPGQTFKEDVRFGVMLRF